MARISEAARKALIEAFEGLQLTAYRDPAGVLTIGYGHTGPDVHEGLTITQEEADRLLQEDLRATEQAVENSLFHPTSQWQFDALVSLAFNIGVEAFRRSSVLSEHNLAKPRATARAFLEYVHAGGQILLGLVRRRAAEAVWYLAGPWD